MKKDESVAVATDSCARWWEDDDDFDRMLVEHERGGVLPEHESALGKRLRKRMQAVVAPRPMDDAEALARFGMVKNPTSDVDAAERYLVGLAGRLAHEPDDCGTVLAALDGVRFESEILGSIVEAMRALHRRQGAFMLTELQAHIRKMRRPWWRVVPDLLPHLFSHHHLIAFIEFDEGTWRDAIERLRVHDYRLQALRKLAAVEMIEDLGQLGQTLLSWAAAEGVPALV